MAKSKIIKAQYRFHSEVSCEGVDRLALNFFIGKDRYHVWFKKDPLTNRVREPLEIEHGFGRKFPTLYHNCAIGLDRRDEGYFDTKYLRADAAVNAVLIREALDRAGDVDVVRVHYIERHTEDYRRLEAEARAARIKQAKEDAAEKMYDALVAVNDSGLLIGSYTIHDRMSQIVGAALTEAEKVETV